MEKLQILLESILGYLLVPLLSVCALNAFNDGLRWVGIILIIFLCILSVLMITLIYYGKIYLREYLKTIKGDKNNA